MPYLQGTSRYCSILVETVIANNSLHICTMVFCQSPHKDTLTYLLTWQA